MIIIMKREATEAIYARLSDVWEIRAMELMFLKV